MRLLDLFVFKYNRTDFHELNLDWIISDMRTLAETLQNFISLNVIKYADPIQWNITTQYEANTVVVDANDGTAYLSVQAVPSGVAITNTDYWLPIFTLNLLSANQNITLRDDGSNVLATFASEVDNWLIWNSTLYKVTRDIALNEAYVVGYNLTRYSVEMFINDYITELKNEIDTLEDSINDKIGDLATLNTIDKTSIVNAINEVVETVADTDIVYIANNHGISSDNDDNTTALQSLIETASINHGIIVFKPGVYKFTGSLTSYYNVKIVGLGSVIFDYSDGTESTFITIPDTLPDGTEEIATGLETFGRIPTIFENIIFMGKSEAAYPTIPTDWKNATCLQINTHEIAIKDCDFKSWDIAVTFGNNAYIDSFTHCRFNHNNTAIKFDLTNISNAGEAIKFNDCVIGNNKLALYNDQGMLFFTDCSIDYNYQIANSNHQIAGAFNGFETYTSCHLEDAGASYDLPRFISFGYTYRNFIGCTFHGMQMPVYSFNSSQDVVEFNSCTMYFMTANYRHFCDSNIGHVINRGIKRSYDSSYAITKINGQGGNLIDSTYQTLSQSVINGTASIADEKLTLTGTTSGVHPVCTINNIPIEKGHNACVFSCIIESANYDGSGLIMEVSGIDQNGNVMLQATSNATITSSMTDTIVKGSLVLNDSIAAIKFVLQNPKNGSGYSLVFKDINMYLS